MKNTAGEAQVAGAQSPQERPTAIQNKKKETEVSPRLINFVLHMYNQLTSEQRYEIYLGIKRKWSISRISHEIEQMIEEDWSPSQIAGVLHKEGIHIAIQTIYNHVHADASGRLAKHMPHELKYTRSVRATRPTKATNIANRTSIHDRPKEADGTRFGDWEMDTIVDSYGHAIVTLTERSTNFILMERLKCGRKAVPTAKVVARLLFPYREFVHTITTDNGCEFAAHLEITRMLSRGGRERGKVYFADSYCSWQKGAIENANKLIRKYIPKKANFDDFSDSKIMKIQKKINRRPREKINFDSPNEVTPKVLCPTFWGHFKFANS